MRFGHAIISLPWNEESIADLQTALGAERYTVNPGRAALDEALADADAAIIGSNADDRFVTAPQLRWLHVDHAGIDAFAPPELVGSELVVTTSAGRSGPAIADHAIFLHQAVLHDLSGMQRNRRRRLWREPDRQLPAVGGGTAVVVGCGHTGAEIAARLSSMGVSVTGVRRTDTPAPAGFERVVQLLDRDDLPSIVQDADAVFLATPLNDSTHHLIGRPELEAMKPAAVLVNVARGAVVDETALVDALRRGSIAGAGLDVVTHEPLSPLSRLWRLSNVVMTPHSAPKRRDRESRSLEIVREVAADLTADRPVARRLSIDDAYTKRTERLRSDTAFTRRWIRLVRPGACSRLARRAAALAPVKSTRNCATDRPPPDEPHSGTARPRVWR